MESSKFLNEQFMTRPFSEWPIKHLPRAKLMSEIPGIRDRYKLFSNAMSCLLSEEEEVSNPPEMGVIDDQFFQLDLPVLPGVQEV